MSHQNYMKVSGALFLVIAIVHLWRVVKDVPIAFGTSFLPMWASYVAIVVGGYLAYHALKK